MVNTSNQGSHLSCFQLKHSHLNTGGLANGWYLFVCCRHGEQAAELTKEGLGAAGHALGTAWAVFKVRKAFNPKSAIKATTLVKSAAKAAAAEAKAKQAK